MENAQHKLVSEVRHLLLYQHQAEKVYSFCPYVREGLFVPHAIVVHKYFQKLLPTAVVITRTIMTWYECTMKYRIFHAAELMLGNSMIETLLVTRLNANGASPAAQLAY